MRLSLKTGLMIPGLLVVTGLVIALLMFNSSAKDLAKVKPEYSISAPELFSVFSADERAATEKFVGRVIEIRGVVGAYDLRDNNLGTVSLVSGDPLGMVICRLANRDDIPDLNPGDTITVKGECSGMLMDVLVNKCVIIP